jgi:hypothetical protein
MINKKMIYYNRKSKEKFLINKRIGHVYKTS